MQTETFALKEWAVIVKALTDGKQLLLMRKGGIAEETKDFQLESRSFYLYPTYEHQRIELLKDEYQSELVKLLEDWNPDDARVEIGCRAEVVEDIEIRSQEELDKLSSFAIWTESFSEERLKWKKKQPLHLLLLRVYNLKEPVRIPIKPEYGGCKSWVSIDVDLRGHEEIAVLDDIIFKKSIQDIKLALQT
ncbi:MAG: DUF1802 family protein [Gorillibacterium sp.]|nr:DUF1802 family protein [Gorillibacterium sp.]